MQLHVIASSCIHQTILLIGTIASGCDSCHDEANCLKTRERGDSFTSQAYSCVCKDGFVGDGLTCLDAKLCSDSSCCSQGYQWSPDMGCVDTDECSLSESPCTPRQVCQNTPGSFACLEPSTQTVLFHSGCSDCPRGMDCIDGHGSRCADPCDQYTKLNDEWRSTDNTMFNRPRCDRNMRWRGWYRMYLGRESAQLPERCLGSHRCGTDAPMWMTKAHPTESNEIVNRKVCAAFEDQCCSYNTDIQVKLCPGNFYVYKLVRPSTCYLAYCAGSGPFQTSFSVWVHTGNRTIQSVFFCGLVRKHEIHNARFGTHPYVACRIIRVYFPPSEYVYVLKTTFVRVQHMFLANQSE